MPLICYIYIYIYSFVQNFVQTENQLMPKWNDSVCIHNESALSSCWSIRSPIGTTKLRHEFREGVEGFRLIGRGYPTGEISSSTTWVSNEMVLKRGQGLKSPSIGRTPRWTWPANSSIRLSRCRLNVFSALRANPPREALASSKKTLLLSA